jgi:uncharacterized protein (TIGR02147 family)
MNLFKFNDYRKYVFAQIEANKDVRGYKTAMANQAGCQKSLISQVIGGRNDLTRDHGAQLADFWGLDEVEAEYFICLIDLAKAGSPRLRAHISKRLNYLRTQARSLELQLREEAVESPSAQMTYYSSWYWSAIHQIVAIERFSTPEAIAARLALPVAVVQKALQRLTRMKVIEPKAGKGYRILRRNLHAPAHSPMHEANQSNWRRRAVADIAKQDEDSLHYTGIFTLEERDYQKLQDLLQKMIRRSRDLIIPSKEEELYCMNCDLFRV